MSDAQPLSDETPQGAAQETRAARCARVLGRLTEMGLELACDLHARALAAETAQEAQALGLAFQRVSRSVRQSLALELKMERDLAQQAREAQSQATLNTALRVNARRTQVTAAMRELIWTESDGNEDVVEDLSEDLAALLDDAVLADDFLDIPLEALVAHVTRQLRLGPEAENAPPPRRPPRHVGWFMDWASDSS